MYAISIKCQQDFFAFYLAYEDTLSLIMWFIQPIDKLHGTVCQYAYGMQFLLLANASGDIMGNITRCSCQGGNIDLLYNIRFQCVFSECVSTLILLGRFSTWQAMAF